ncbi:MAG: glycosyltransferase family 4 protein [Chloroflexota bacterium]
MRFLILTQYYPPEIGAAQARLSAFAGQLVRAGHEVEVVTALPNYPTGRLDEADRRLLGRREVLDGIPVRRSWLLTATGVGARRLASYLSFAATGLVSALVAGRPDVVFVESPPLFLGVSGWMAARRAGAAFVLNVSDLWPDSVRDLGVLGDGPALRAAERLERWLYARATAVTAVTEGIRETLVERKGVPERKALFLPNGVDLQQFRPTEPDPAVRARHGLPPDGPLVLFTGNHGYAQALETVIAAAALAPEVTVVLVGAGSDKARIQALAEERGTTNVRFLAPVPQAEIAPLYGHAVAGLATLRNSALMEGARPAKALAVMGCGRPVIYSGAGEGAALVRAAEAGLVVPPEDPRALAAAIRRLVQDPEEAARMGANGRRYVESHLSWPALTDAWLTDLKRVLGQDPSTVDAPHHAS